MGRRNPSQERRRIYAAVPAAIAASLGAGLSFVTGLVSSASATFVGNGLEMLTGDREEDWTALLIDTIASEIIGGVSGAVINIPKINMGRNSMHQVYKAGLTKVWRKGFDMPFKVMFKGFIMNFVTGYGDTTYTILYG